ncbi:hypothetical protein [Sideroxydans lithotrophicus]|uniref:Uncharacterized protein n=1 Tax=Sideroxydans lithotrophicus (strain ES-1) TaxID=580332 RepID=D5CT68_SIDLE|nr:hypothetical protein [Sideroxydans lithotrophicus]ADE12154.1 hypothetical protein Slit_1925 [Sideroxydans lithotrophicus ES-1]
MKHADKVIELLAAYPGREFRMRQIVNYINPKPSHDERCAIRSAVSLVLLALVESGQIKMSVPKSRGSFALYAWKVLDDAGKSVRECVSIRAG